MAVLSLSGTVSNFCITGTISAFTYCGLSISQPKAQARVPIASYNMRKFLVWYNWKQLTSVCTISSRNGVSCTNADSVSVASALQAASCTRLFLSKHLCSSAFNTAPRTCSLLAVCSPQIHEEKRERHQQ